MAYWVGGDWFYHMDPKLSGRFYIGADGGIYEQAGAPTGYQVEIRTYIVDPRGEFPVDANGTVSGDPFEEFADAVEESNRDGPWCVIPALPMERRQYARARLAGFCHRNCHRTAGN